MVELVNERQGGAWRLKMICEVDPGATGSSMGLHSRGRAHKFNFR
jgi:hypothetical protein